MNKRIKAIFGMVLFCGLNDDTKDPVPLCLSACLSSNINLKPMPRGGKMAAALPGFISGRKMQRENWPLQFYLPRTFRKVFICIYWA